MKNKYFHLWRKICPKCLNEMFNKHLNENVTYPRLKKKKKKKLSPFQHEKTSYFCDNTITKEEPTELYQSVLDGCC